MLKIYFTKFKTTEFSYFYIFKFLSLKIYITKGNTANHKSYNKLSINFLIENISNNFIVFIDFLFVYSS